MTESSQLYDSQLMRHYRQNSLAQGKNGPQILEKQS